MQGKRRLMCSGERENRNYQEHEKASSFHLPEFQNSFFILFLGKCLIHFLCRLLLLCYLFLQESVQIAVHTFTDVLQNRCSMQKSCRNHLTGKHLCWRFFLINFIKKRHQHRCFPVNIAKCLSTAFYIEHLPFIIRFRNFM